MRRCARLAYARHARRIGREPAPVTADIAGQIVAGYVHVAEEGGALVGYVSFRVEGDGVLLESVAVLPACAGRGIGRALITHCEAAARDAGHGTVRLYTNEKMTDNLALYPHLGYAETGRRIEDDFARVYFEKRL